MQEDIVSKLDLWKGTPSGHFEALVGAVHLTHTNAYRGTSLTRNTHKNQAQEAEDKEAGAGAAKKKKAAPASKVRGLGWNVDGQCH